MCQTDKIQFKILHFDPCCHGNGVARVTMLHVLYVMFSSKIFSGLARLCRAITVVVSR